MKKKVFFFVAAIFLLWQSSQLWHSLNQMKTLGWPLSILLAWLLNLFVTGIFAFSVFGFPVEKLLPPVYYKIHRPSVLKKVYVILQVNFFRKLLLATLWRSQKQQQKYFNGKKNGLDHLVEQSQKSEFGHLIPFVILNIMGIKLLLNGTWQLGLSTLLINLIGNLYPVLLQRHHRMRIQRLRRRQSA